MVILYSFGAETTTADKKKVESGMCYNTYINHRKYLHNTIKKWSSNIFLCYVSWNIFSTLYMSSGNKIDSVE